MLARTMSSKPAYTARTVSASAPAAANAERLGLPHVVRLGHTLQIVKLARLERVPQRLCTPDAPPRFQDGAVTPARLDGRGRSLGRPRRGSPPVRRPCPRESARASAAGGRGTVDGAGVHAMGDGGRHVGSPCGSAAGVARKSENPATRGRGARSPSAPRGRARTSRRLVLAARAKQEGDV